MKTKQLLVFILLLTANTLFAQKGIKGLVKDANSGETLPFVTVKAIEKASNKPFGVFTNNNGTYELKLKEGKYDVIFSFIGYQNDTIKNISITQGGKWRSLSTTSLSTATHNIGDVNVIAKRSTVQATIEKKSYNTKDFETAKGGTAVDILNKLPSVDLDADGNVSVRGTTDFMVYLNGKPTQMDPSVLLGQIAGDAIKSIDVITIPTAKYDAQGKGGIINIETNKGTTDGFSITANGLIGGSPWGNLTDKYSGYELNDNRYSTGVNASFTKDKFSIYGGLFYNKKNVNGNRSGDARLLQKDGSYYHMVAQGERPEWYEYYTAQLGADYSFTDKTTLSASYFYGNRNDGRSAFYVYDTFYADENKKDIAGIDRNEKWIYNPNTDNRYGQFHSSDLHLAHKFSATSKIDIDLLYEYSALSRELDNRNYDFNKPLDQVETKTDHFKQTDDTPLHAYRASIDYEKQFDNKSQLTVGFQPQWMSIAGTFSYDTLNVNTQKWGDYSSLENGVDMNRGIYAFYADYRGDIGAFSYVLGLRAEYMDQQMKIDNPDYFNIFDRKTDDQYNTQKLDWFPSLHLNYSLSENNSISASASRRINRPALKDMAPFLYRRHYEVYVVGDPTLEPEYLNNLEVQYGWKGSNVSINLTGFYRGTDNAVFRVNTVYEEENVLIRSYTNSGNTQSLGAELNSSINMGRFGDLFLGGSLYNYKVEGNIFGYKESNQSTNWSFKGNLNLNITKTIKWSSDFNVKSATVTAQGQNELYYQANTALVYKPTKLKGWDFSVRALDILSSNITGLSTRAYDTNGVQIFYQDTEYRRNGPILELRASYSLNKIFKKSKTDSAFGKSQF
ncbi:TonB-dependent receptor family protein [Halosquirtibacter xylanolyticus]|uniref:outer membrane beta-barrel family protein n=1 Tax=Halosquirtibacter xylanolyticus TaxID=3374599 RepID=UPI003748024F|nr:TonB-dependent receptor family protein [Prolixibacteraceae bacterium]